MFACLTMALVFALGSFAGNDMPRYVDGYNSVIHGGNLDMSKAAARDTVHLIGPWGSRSVVNGQFEDSSGAADWNGWTHVDLTLKTEATWHADTYNVVSGNYSAWCGDIGFVACTETDVEGGYGSGWNEYLTWYGTAGNSNQSSTVDISATVNHNTEPGYDFSNLGYWKADAGIEYLWSADGVGVAVAVSGSVTYQSSEYVGDGSNQVRITWHVVSDGAWDDSDCLYYGNGALQIDDVVVTMTNDGVVTTTTDGFEDGTLGVNWEVEFPVGVGDYAHIRTQLADKDPCANNFTPQACFIADEVMAADPHFLPVKFAIDWGYGPGGYIVHTQGGAAGPEAHLHNAIESPVIAWPVGDYLGTRFVFDAYRHEDLSNDAPGMFYTWGIRSTIDPTGADIFGAGWADRNFVYYGGPDYIRGGEADATDLVVPGRTFVQVQLAAYELGYAWGWVGDDGYPAPFFDNVSLKVYDYFGPGMSARELDLANDNFPSSGVVASGVDMINNVVRFDMANNISLATDEQNDPGDSSVIDIVAVRTGSALVLADDGLGHTAPTLYWTLKAGASVDVSWRTGLTAAGYIGLDVNGNLHGAVEGEVAYNNGIASPDKWAFDLPDGEAADDRFFYPGDVIHWYVEAWDEVTGDFQNATMPANLEGYGDFTAVLKYNSTFIVRALPTLFSDVAGDQPEIIFWNDFANRGGEDEWYTAFANLGFYEGEDFDTYYTNGPSSGVGNGIGGRAAIGQLDNYDIMVYTCGDLGVNTISNLDWDNDSGNDVGVLNDWMNGGGKYLFATGDELVADMTLSLGTTAAFVTDWMGVSYFSNDVSQELGDDVAPMVYAVDGNSVFETTDSWIAYGGCRVINTFDAVTVAAGAEGLAVFNDGTSGYSAATKFVHLNTSVCVSMPYDFMYIRTPPTAPVKLEPAPISARAALLGQAMTKFGKIPNEGFETAVNTPKVFSLAANYPNPFNPMTKIAFTMPKMGHLTLKVFNVRGELVRTLVNEVKPMGDGHVMWDGTSDQGKRVSSGVYFYEARTETDVQVQKMALVK